MCKPVAAGALDVHEVRVGVLEPLQLVPSLLLVVGGWSKSLARGISTSLKRFRDRECDSVGDLHCQSQDIQSLIRLYSLSCPIVSMDLCSIGNGHLDLEITKCQNWLDSGKQTVAATNQIV